MKKIDLERELKELGWWFKRHGGEHDIWTNGYDTESIPRHKQVNEILARKILKTVKFLNRQSTYENRR